MGGRYGESDDGSSDYQDRRPDDDGRSDEQQTIAEAVQTVADQQHSDDGGSTSGRTDEGGSSGSASRQHPFTTLRPGTSQSGRTTLQDVDQTIAEYVAETLTDTVEEAIEETDPDRRIRVDPRCGPSRTRGRSGSCYVPSPGILRLSGAVVRFGAT